MTESSSTTQTTREARQATLRADMVTQIRARAGKPMAPRRRRLALAYGYLSAVAVGAAAPIFLGSGLDAIVQLLAVLGVAGLLIALRSATRLVTDAPEEALPESYVRLRDRSFRLSYQLLAAIAVLISAVLFGFGRGGVEEPLALALAWLGLGAALGIPLIVVAAAFPDVRSEEGCRTTGGTCAGSCGDAQLCSRSPGQDAAEPAAER